MIKAISHPRGADYAETVELAQDSVRVVGHWHIWDGWSVTLLCAKARETTICLTNVVNWGLSSAE